MQDAPTPKLAFEDFPVGETIAFGDYRVTEEDVVAFARQFDPQPVHLDRQAAESSILGGLCASGWHTCGMLMRMMCDGFLNDSTSLGAPGITELNWLRPVRPGDRLRATRTCLEARISGSRPHVGICLIRYEVFNQNDKAVLSAEVTQLFGRREAAA